MAAITIADTTLPVPPRSSMHLGCCPTTGPPTTADSLQMAHILGEAQRREEGEANDLVVESVAYAAESSPLDDSVQ